MAGYLPTTLLSCLWSSRSSLASGQDHTLKTEHENKTLVCGTLLEGYSQQHNQVVPSSCINNKLSYCPRQLRLLVNPFASVFLRDWSTSTVVVRGMFARYSNFFANNEWRYTILQLSYSYYLLYVQSITYLSWLKSGSSTISSKRSVSAFNLINVVPSSGSIWK